MTRPVAALVAVLLGTGAGLTVQGREHAVTVRQAVVDDVPDLTCPARRAAPRRRTPAPVPLSPDAPPAVSELDGLPGLDEPVPQTLEPSAIGRFALPAPGSATVRRIALWGDSHLAAGSVSAELRRLLEQQGYAVGSRHLPASFGRSGVRLPVRRACVGPSWTYEAAYRETGEGAYGPGLMNLRSTAPQSGAYLWLDLRDAERHRVVRRAVILYRRPVVDVTVSVSINNGPRQARLLPAVRDAEGERLGRLEISAEDPLATVKLSIVAGAVTIHGVVLDPVRTPAVVLDTFGLPSATVRGWGQVDTNYLTQSLGDEPYEAVVLAYGTNEGNVRVLDVAAYTRVLETALSKMRAVMPQASCVLVGPTDRGVRVRRRQRGRVDLLRFSAVHRQITEIQSEVGARFGCASWSWQATMGGAGGAYRWLYADPPLMASDLTHLTPAGYRRTAGALARSLGWWSRP